MATDNVEKGIRRGDAEVALHALSRLAAAERGPFLEPVGALFRAAVESDHRAKNWSKLISWASRAEKVPGLEGAPGSAALLETSWSLTWAAIKTKDWPRAERWYQSIRTALLEVSPAFAAAMEAVVAGRATPEAVAPFVLDGSVEDPRLGQEKKRVRAEWATPVGVVETEQTLLAMVASEPWPVFATNVTQWTPKVDAVTRSHLLHLAGQLATRETVRRLASSKGNSGEPANLLRFAVEHLRAPAALEDDALLMFRLLAGRGSKENGHDAGVRELTHAAAAASAYVALRPVVMGFVASFEVPASSTGAFMTLIDHLLLHQPELELVGKALLSLVAGGPEDALARRPSSTLTQALTKLAGTQSEALSRWFNELDPDLRYNFAQWMGFVLPVETVRAFIVATWSLCPKARSDLIVTVENVILSARDASVDDLEFLTEPLEGALPQKARPFWNAVRDLVLPEDLAFLPFALREDKGQNPFELVDRALGEKPSIGKMLDAWGGLWRDGYPALCEHVEAALFRLHGENLHSLIHGVIDASEAQLPVAFQRRLAQALHEQRNGTVNCSDLGRALRRVDALLKPRKPKQKKKTVKKKTVKKKSPPPDDNGSLPF